jgi:hypothetical protein
MPELRNGSGRALHQLRGTRGGFEPVLQQLRCAIPA